MTLPCARVPALIFLLLWVGTGSLAAEGPELFNSDLPEVSQCAGPDGVYLTRSDGPWGSDSRLSILYRATGKESLQLPLFARGGADEGNFYYSPAQRRACFTSDRAAHDARRNWLWVLNNASANLVALDAGTGEIKNTVALGSPPLGLAFDARGDRLLIGLPRRNEVIAVSAASGDIVLRSGQVMEVDDIDLVPAAYFGSSPDT